MSLLTLIQDACDEIGLPAPTSVIGNSDQSVKQLLALLNSAGEDLVQRMAWQECVREASFTTIAQEEQGTLESKAPGFNWVVYETMWNRTTREYVSGPLFPKEWQFLKGWVADTTFPKHRIRGKSLLFTPAPTAGQSIYFEYVSRYYCTSAAGADQERLTADTDLFVLPERLMKREVIWRFKAAKGFAYGEDFRMAEEMVTNAMARNGSKRVLSLAREPDYRPFVSIPEGNWGQ